ILNKIDLETKIDEKDKRLKQASDCIIKISALNNLGIEKLYDEITNLFNLNEINLDNEIVITNIRHKNLIEKAIKNVKKTKDTLKNQMPLDIIAIFIKDILEDLGNITGEIVNEDIINEIFAKFCLGK
ncbi:MAG: tRNA uridine-5-carboxymethylaminomethyl(34) synthesis GTPase MnmE, partial [Bacilli bacterium]|nr:tRNA uridine-5-carboxymethylaminomethyl(34) synthesis GTPase MnmE [Bacilli bacterium]